MIVVSSALSNSLLSAYPDASGYSRFVQRIRRRYADQLHRLPPGAPVRATLQTTLDALLADGLETGAALRVLRQIVMERLVVLECQDVAPTLPTACGSLPPEGALRLRPGEAGSAALAGEKGEPTIGASPADPGLDGLVFYTTGRLTSEMVIKSAQMGVPIVVSRSGITQMGHQVAQAVGEPHRFGGA